MPGPVKRVSLASSKAANEPMLPAKSKPTKAKPTKPKAAARRTAAPANSESKVAVFQIHFKGEHEEHLDSAFQHYDNQGVQTETHEFAVFQKLSKSAKTRGLTHWGAVSWRFFEKTGMHGEELIKIVQANPGVDVFYMNPYPYNEALFQSGWMQGETTHPDFLELARQFLVAAGFDEKEVLRVNQAAEFSAANYFVGSAAFWKAYIPFIEGALARAERKMPIAVRKRIHSPDADVRSLHHGATYIPFIVERMFALFMRTEGKALTARKIALPAQEAKLNQHLRSLRLLKDAAVRGKSKELYAIWANFRNLYCQAVFKRSWCETYLKTLNPAQLVL